MTVDELQHGATVRARFGRYRDDLSHPDWGPWEPVTLHVQRDRSGRICVLAVRPDWAEYNPRRDPPSADGVLECEGYYLQIEGLQGD